MYRHKDVKTEQRINHFTENTQQFNPYISSLIQVVPVAFSVVTPLILCLFSLHKKCEETALRPQRHSHLTQGETAITDGPSKASLVGYLTAGLHLLLLIFWH